MLSSLLLSGEVLIHPFVIGELACGALRKREIILSSVSALPKATVASHDEAMHLLIDARLSNRGRGWIDVHLLSSARLSGALLWTLDAALAQAAEELRVAFPGSVS